MKDNLLSKILFLIIFFLNKNRNEVTQEKIKTKQKLTESRNSFKTSSYLWPDTDANKKGIKWDKPIKEKVTRT